MDRRFASALGAGGAVVLHPGVAGAWIGTSEFADAAGFAAAAAYGSIFANMLGELLERSEICGTPLEIRNGFAISASEDFIHLYAID